MAKTTVANYLITRLEQFGLRSVFGVPGDFNLVGPALPAALPPRPVPLTLL